MNGELTKDNEVLKDAVKKAVAEHKEKGTIESDLETASTQRYISPGQIYKK